MKATQEFTNQNNIAEVDTWVPIGASKRGWTTWLIGATATKCQNCVKIGGIIPFVPIVPGIVDDLHRMW